MRTIGKEKALNVVRQVLGEGFRFLYGRDGFPRDSPAVSVSFGPKGRPICSMRIDQRVRVSLTLTFYRSMRAFAGMVRDRQL